MRRFPTWIASCGVVCLLLPTSAHADKKKEELSSLKAIAVDTKTDDITVALDGSRAPDFTSFTMSEPFRVVVDWAGSKLDGVKAERSFDRGLVRRVTTQQFDSEAEKISRVVIELAQKTAYRVEADGTRVIVHFVPVATPIPEPAPEPVIEPEPVKEEKVAAYVPEGPLTEPDVPVPTEAPKIVAKAEPKPKAAPKPAPVVAKAPAPKPAPVAKKAPEPAPVVAVAPKQAEKKPAPAPKKPEPVDPVAAVIAPDAPAVPADAPLTEPVMEEPKPAPVKKEEPVRLAKFVPSEPKPSEPKPVETPPVPTPKVEAPPAAKPTPPKPQRTQQLAAKPDLDRQWSPPAVAPPKRTLPVVKLAQADTLEPTRTTPADPDTPTMEERPATNFQPSSSDGADPMDFDPGPRVLTYIGFRQMADVSRVFVRVDGKAQFRKLEEGTRFSLELVDTSVNVKNNERPLDTTYFNSPVTKIKATTVGGNTRIDVDLRELVPHRIKRIGTTLAIDFTRR